MNGDMGVRYYVANSSVDLYTVHAYTNLLANVYGLRANSYHKYPRGISINFSARHRPQPFRRTHFLAIFTYMCCAVCCSTVSVRVCVCCVTVSTIAFDGPQRKTAEATNLEPAVHDQIIASLVRKLDADQVSHRLPTSPQLCAPPRDRRDGGDVADGFLRRMNITNFLV